MSRRARASRRLASLLTAKAGTYVRIYYDRQTRRYRVVWTDGPAVVQMHAFAVEQSRVEDLPGLDISALLWHRDGE
jgi:hypothetical protein